MNVKLNVLSLFDGMSCARIALDRAGIGVNRYFAAEVDKYAIKVAQANYPDTVQLGDVRNIMWPETFELEKINLLIGGSPCQGFSFAGKQLNFDDPRSALFWEYVRLLKECKPRYFLLENVRMNQRSQDVITEALGVQPVPINSSLVSAQNRKRLYWTNIPFKYPLDKEIMMKDILQDPSEISPEHYHSMKAVEYMEKGNNKWGQAGSRRADGYEQTPETQKSFTLTANMHKGVPYNYFKDTRNGLIRAGDADLKGHDYVRRVYHPDGKAPTLCASSGGNLEPKTLASETTWRKLTPIECERLQTVPDNYTAHVSNTQRYKMLGNGFTVDVISQILRGILPPAYTK
jgi:DNA-cytosine methyltransferase